VEVLNLPIAIREDELKRYFLQFGKVASITQELLNRKAIIGFSSLDGKNKAISLGSGQTLGDRIITVKRISL
jgi:RNA recognition motif-containing protein